MTSVTIEKIEIGGITYPVECIKDLRDGDTKLDGHTIHRPFSIRLEDKLCEQGKRVVLWHEVLHAIVAQAGIKHRDEYEQPLDALAYGLVQVLRDNPGLRNA